MRSATTVVILAAALSVAVLSSAQLGQTRADEFEISRWTIDGGGVMESKGGEFELSGTIGQPDTGILKSYEFTLTGGFWFEQPPGDCNSDGWANLYDYSDLAWCLTGPEGELKTNCDCFDVDNDDDVDLLDAAQFQSAFGK